MELAGAEQVVVAPDLVAGRHPEALADHDQAHRPIEAAILPLELEGTGELARIRAAIGRLGGTDTEQPVNAVEGEGKGYAQPLQPGSQPQRGGDRQGEG
jgi:hypothetical protein